MFLSFFSIFRHVPDTAALFSDHVSATASGHFLALRRPRTFARRAVGARDVLIDMRYCGVCHTDLHTAAGHMAGVMGARYRAICLMPLGLHPHTHSHLI
jgi:hypothetical protein